MFRVNATRDVILINGALCFICYTVSNIVTITDDEHELFESFKVDIKKTREMNVCFCLRYFISYQDKVRSLMVTSESRNVDNVQKFYKPKAN